jgi:acid stress-induced BolA-like protein IbaG/YrbA
MALQIIDNAIDPTQLLRDALGKAFPGDRVEVETASPGHYRLRVVSAAFAGKTRIAQQQLVYAAITHLMAGNAAPVHAIDRMETLLP